MRAECLEQIKIVIVVRRWEITQGLHLAEGNRGVITCGFLRDNPRDRGYLLMAFGISEMTNQSAQRELALTIDHKVNFRKHPEQVPG